MNLLWLKPEHTLARDKALYISLSPDAVAKAVTISVTGAFLSCWKESN